MAKPAIQSNRESDLYAEALRVFTENKGAEDRARGNTKRNQLMYESQGVSATMIRSRYKEANMSQADREALYAEEVKSRRALNLWNAESPDDFERALERAVAMPPATTEALEALEGARAYNDGFNGGAHGGLTPDDNKHVPGTVQYQQWARGCLDGIDYKENFELPSAEPPAEPEPAPEQSAPRKARNRKAPAQAVADDVAAIVAEELDQSPDDLPGDGMFSDMPAVPGLPN